MKKILFIISLIFLTGCNLAVQHTHSYDNSCDKFCNTCYEERTITHKGGQASCKEKAKCSVCGEEYGDLSAHSYDNVAVVKSAYGHVFHCTVCGVESDIKQHNKGPEATEDSAQYCLDCGYEITPALSHTHKENNEYTSNESSHWYTCSCGEKMYEEEHVYSNTCDTSCNECDYERTITHTYDNNCDSKCNVCNATRTTSHAYDSSCDDTCNECGAKRTVGEHTYSGFNDVDCNNCDYERTLEFKIETRYNKTLDSNLVQTNVTPAVSGAYVVDVEFVKTWGFIRFYCNGVLITTDNTTFENIGTWNDSAWTTKLYLDSDEALYQKGQLNFSYSESASYRFKYIPEENKLVVTYLESEDSEFDLDLFPTDLVRFSSLYLPCESSSDATRYMTLEIPYDDTYKVTTSTYSSMTIYSINGEVIFEVLANTTKSFNAAKGDVYYVIVKTSNYSEYINIYVELVENYRVLPYDPQEMVDAEALLAKDKSHLTENLAATISYTKREGGLYINSNNPEKLTSACVNTALTRDDVSNKEVFFTYEHNNELGKTVYYGYQVINKGTEDIYVTVKNIGFQASGAGNWFGEKEWIDFYNTEFEMLGYSNFTNSQMSTLNAYYGFCNTYKPSYNQPITYCIPSGEYIYVIGGTTTDAYANINVFNTANQGVKSSCSNGAVLFEVVGDNAEGAFFVYDDPSKVSTSNQTHYGYEYSALYGWQYKGSDDCHGVVDAHLTWEFNDNMSEYLPVSFTNYYKDSATDGGTPFGKVGSTAHNQYTWTWKTHINPQTTHTAVGTDMTAYNTVDGNGNPIVIDYDHYDGYGNLANIGNWMMDYMEYYTFVNHGNRDRTITIKMTNNGVIAALIRDKDGNYIDNSARYSVYCPFTDYGASIDDSFTYTVTVPAKGYVQFIIEYNLLANSYGCINHNVYLA